MIRIIMFAIVFFLLSLLGACCAACIAGTCQVVKSAQFPALIFVDNIPRINAEMTCYIWPVE